MKAYSNLLLPLMFTPIVFFGSQGSAANEVVRPRVLSIRRIPQYTRGERFMIFVHHAVRWGERYLATVTLIPASPRVQRAQWERYGYVIAHTAVGLFSSSWEPIRIGSDIIDPHRDRRTLLSVFHVPAKHLPGSWNGLAVQNWIVAFPRILLRDPVAEKCPFVFAHALGIVCLDPFLEPEKRISLPFQATDYIVMEKAVWAVAPHGGHLLHRIDLHTGKVVHSLVPIREVIEHLRSRGFTDDAYFQYLAGDKVRRLQREALRRTAEAIEKKSGMQLDMYIKTEANFTERTRLEWLRIPAGIPIAGTARGNFVYLLIERPLSLVRVIMPEGQVVGVYPLRKEDLPARLHRYQQLRIVDIEIYKDELIATVHFERGVTFQEYLQTNPVEASRLRRRFQEKHPGQDVAPDYVVYIDWKEYAFVMSNDGKIHYSIRLPSPGESLPGYELWVFRPLSMPLIVAAPDELLLTARKVRRDGGIAGHGMAYLSLK